MYRCTFVLGMTSSPGTHETARCHGSETSTVGVALRRYPYSDSPRRWRAEGTAPELCVPAAMTYTVTHNYRASQRLLTMKHSRNNSSVRGYRLAHIKTFVLFPSPRAQPWHIVIMKRRRFGNSLRLIAVGTIQ
jgi:hypothetical protein